MIQRIAQNRSVTYFLVVIILLQLLPGCSSSKGYRAAKGLKYRYVYELVSPRPIFPMRYQDSKIKIHFTFDDATLGVKNLTFAPVVIRWSGVSLDADTAVYIIKTSTTYFNDSLRPPANAQIQPSQILSDFVIPEENLHFIDDEWLEEELFPTVDDGMPGSRRRIMENIGKEFLLHFPLIEGNTEYDYRFKFRITSIEPVRETTPLVLNPRPVRPISPITFPSKVHFIAFTIIAGMVGGAYYLITQKKNTSWVL
jgi:hypothetical protein